MEERKKIGPFGILGLVLLAVILAVVCFLSAGLPDLSLGLGSWGVYRTDAESLYLASAYLETDTRDLLITSRKQTPMDGELVTYIMDGRRTVDFYDDLLGHPVLATENNANSVEPVIHIFRDAGAVLRFLHQWRYLIWSAAGAAVLIIVVLLSTSKARWRRRQQKLMKANFQRYGEKYRQEDEDMDY